MSDYPVSPRTRMRRKAKRAVYDKAAIHAILDEALIASVSAVIDGGPQVQPMIHARVGDEVILHGLAGNRLLSAIAGGGEACINVCLLDALALARTIEEHSMLYRSATVYGRGTEVTDAAEKMALMEKVFAAIVRSERMAALPPLEPGYLAGTMVVRVPIAEAVGKVNSAVETDKGPDGIWSGLVPVRTEYGPAEPDARTELESLAPDRSIVDYQRTGRGS